jgi:hypothetical protein
MQKVRLLTRIGIGLVVTAAAYLVLLVVAGWIAGGMVADRVRASLADSLDATVTVGDAQVGLISGTATIEELHLERDRVDRLELVLHRVEVDVAPMGWVVVDREPRDVRVRGGRLTITGPEALVLPPRPKKPPIRVGGLEIEDGVVDLMATGYWPGLVHIVITIERARAGATTLRTGLSWVFTLEELVATVQLPANLTVKLVFHEGTLSASGGFFGATPVTIPFELPPLDDRSEVVQLVALGKELGKQLAIERARRWLGSQLAP